MPGRDAQPAGLPGDAGVNAGATWRSSRRPCSRAGCWPSRAWGGVRRRCARGGAGVPARRRDGTGRPIRLALAGVAICWRCRRSPARCNDLRAGNGGLVLLGRGVVGAERLEPRRPRRAATGRGGGAGAAAGALDGRAAPGRRRGARAWPASDAHAPDADRDRRLPGGGVHQHRGTDRVRRADRAARRPARGHPAARAAAARRGDQGRADARRGGYRRARSTPA